jgi:hypothetical protein
MYWPVYVVIYERNQNSATSYRQCTELSVSRSDRSRAVIKHSYDYIDACATVLWLVLKRVRELYFYCKNRKTFYGVK